MIRSFFLLTTFVTFVLTQDNNINSLDSEGFQYEANCLKQSDFITDVDVETINGIFAFVGDNNRWKCMEITISHVTPEDIETIKNRDSNYEKFPELKWDQAIRKLSFSKDISDTLMWKKENGQTIFLGDDREIITSVFKKYDKSVLWIVTGGFGTYPIGIQVSSDVKTKCIADEEVIDSYMEENLVSAYTVHNFC